MRNIPVVYMDACCFIDLAKHDFKMQTRQDREPHIFYCRKFIEAARKNDATVYTSTISVVECIKLTDDLSSGGPTTEDARVKELFKGMLMSARSGVLPVIPQPRITELARDLRWDHGITCKAMDAIHIATALSMKCSHFLTTDAKLGAENVKKIGALGLAVCTADKLADLLPDEYKQLPLRARHEAEPERKRQIRARAKEEP
jgi:predicted nucleic acid-binding protein